MSKLGFERLDYRGCTRWNYMKIVENFELDWFFNSNMFKFVEFTIMSSSSNFVN